MAATTDQVNAWLVTLSQNALAITGKTMAPHNAPTKTSATRISKEKLARMMPITVATTIVARPISNIFSGSALSLAMFLPYTSAITIADKAHRSESAVDEIAPITNTKNKPTINGDKYSATTCGIKLLVSPPSGSIPAVSADRPIMPGPITIATSPRAAVITVGLMCYSTTASQ